MSFSCCFSLLSHLFFRSRLIFFGTTYPRVLTSGTEPFLFKNRLIISTSSITLIFLLLSILFFGVELTTVNMRLSSFNVKCVFVSQTGNVHFSYDPSGGRGGNGGREGNQYNVVRRPDVLVQPSHHVLDSGETIVISGNLASTPLSSHHNIDDGQVRIVLSNTFLGLIFFFTITSMYNMRRYPTKSIGMPKFVHTNCGRLEIKER